MSDLIIRNARLSGGGPLTDIAIEGGKFRSIGPELPFQGKEETDAAGGLVIPPFVESHIHLDSALTVGIPRDNESGTLGEGISILAGQQGLFSDEEILERAREAVCWQVSSGVLRIRTHANVADPSLQGLRVLLTLRDQLRDLVDIQVVAFPQHSLYAVEGSLELMEEALRLGADVVGGMPQMEMIREDGVRAVETSFQLAGRYGRMLDFHADETGDEQSRFTEVIAACTLKEGMEGRVAASHVTALHNYNNDYAEKLIRLLAQARVSVITNPFSNAVLQNRLDGYPRRRGHTRVDQLTGAGVNVSAGSDNVMDPIGPLGRGSVVASLNFLAHYGHLSGASWMEKLVRMVTENGALTLGDSTYGIRPGNPADCLVLRARDEAEVVRLGENPLQVIRRGRVVARTTPAVHTLFLPEGTRTVEYRVSGKDRQ